MPAGTPSNRSHGPHVECVVQTYIRRLNSKPMSCVSCLRIPSSTPLAPVPVTVPGRQYLAGLVEGAPELWRPLPLSLPAPWLWLELMLCPLSKYHPPQNQTGRTGLTATLRQWRHLMFPTTDFCIQQLCAPALFYHFLSPRPDSRRLFSLCTDQSCA